MKQYLYVRVYIENMYPHLCEYVHKPLLYVQFCACMCIVRVRVSTSFSLGWYVIFRRYMYIGCGMYRQNLLMYTVHV